MTVKHRYLSGLNESSCTYLIRLRGARAENGFNRKGSVLGYETAAGKRLDQRKWLAGKRSARWIAANIAKLPELLRRE
jgi:hypothetical protein